MALKFQPRGATQMARGGIRLVHGHTKSTLITYFSGMKIDPNYAFLHAFFLICPSCPFPKFVYMTKNTPFFSNFARFCTPKRCTCVQCLVLKNNPNCVNFWTSLIPPLTFEWPPGISVAVGLLLFFKIVLIILRRHVANFSQRCSSALNKSVSVMYFCKHYNVL